MEIIWPFLLSFIAGLSTLIGVIPIFIPIKNKDKFIAFSLGLSLSIMISISVFDLIPGAIKLVDYSLFKGVFVFSLYFMIGYMIVKMIDHKIEVEKGSSKSLYKLGLLSLIALIMHNVPEGILTFLATYKDFHLGITLCIGIALHNIPEGMAISIPIYYSKKSRVEAIKKVLLSSISEPIGALLAFLILKNYLTNELLSKILVIVSGIMITLAIEDMLSTALTYNNKKALIAGISIGILITILSVFIL